MTKSQIQVETFPNDKKSYRYLELENHMRVLVIHDPETAIDQDESDLDCDQMYSEDDDASSSEYSSESSSEEGSDCMDTCDRFDQDSEASVKKAAVCVCVGVGSFQDPDDVQGMSHLLEHMLFMGSEQFPGENEYDAFVQQHGGSTNAYTDMEHTSYVFDVIPSRLQECLQRFSAFFRSPLCSQSSMEREINAVHAEFEETHSSDTARLAQLLCHKARAQHVMHKFTAGNKLSLAQQPEQSGVDVHERLLKYWRDEYSSERMCVVIRSGHELDVLEGWARDMFKDVINRNVGLIEYSGQGLPYSAGQSFSILPSMKQQHYLHLTFTLPPLVQHYTTHPEEYIGHMLGHEAPGSLYHALRERGLATKLHGGIENDGMNRNTAFSLLSLSICLTDKGMYEGDSLCGEVLRLTFGYLKLLREQGVREEMWRELQAIGDIRFRFQEDEDASEYVQELATCMHQYKPEHILSGGFLLTHYDQDLLQTCFDAFSPTNQSMHLYLVTHHFQTIATKALSVPGHVSNGAELEQGVASVVEQCHEQCAQQPEGGIKHARIVHGDCVWAHGHEPWYDINYMSCDIPQSVAQTWSSTQIDPCLIVPACSTYIPTDLTLHPYQPPTHPDPQPPPQRNVWSTDQYTLPPHKELTEQAGHVPSPPVQVVSLPDLNVWFKQDQSFQVPKASVYVRISRDSLLQSVTHSARTFLVLAVLADELNDDVYMASLGDLDFHQSLNQPVEVQLKFDGYSQKMPVLLERVIQTLSTLKAKPKTFPSLKEQAVRELRNSAQRVEQQANATRLYAITKNRHWFQDLRQAVENVSIDEVAQQAQLCLGCGEGASHVHVQMLVAGNFTEACAHSMAEVVQKRINKGGLVTENGVKPSSSPQGPPTSALSVPGPVPYFGQCHVIPRGTTIVAVPSSNVHEHSCACHVYAQGPLATPRARALGDIVVQILYEPMFDELRTRQCLGYSVYPTVHVSYGVTGLSFVVVAANFHAAELLTRMDKFLIQFLAKLQDMSEEEYVKQRSGVLKEKQQPPFYQSQEAYRHWYDITHANGDFGGPVADLAELNTVTKQQVLQYYKQYIMPTSSTVRRLVINVDGQSFQESDEDEPNGKVSGMYENGKSMAVDKVVGAKKAANAGLENGGQKLAGLKSCTNNQQYGRGYGGTVRRMQFGDILDWREGGEFVDGAVPGVWGEVYGTWS